jgi:hypothetical protein
VLRRSTAPTSSLYGSFAELFRAFTSDPGSGELPTSPPSALPMRRSAYRGGDMTSDPAFLLRRSTEPDVPTPGSDLNTRAGRATPVMPRAVSRQLDELVDLVVARIEQRVIDELERRGRRGIPGAF